MRQRRGDRHIDEPSDEFRGTAEVDHVVVSSAARQFTRVLAGGAFDENALARADHALCDLPCLRIDSLLQPGEPRELHFLRRSVGKVGRGGARPPAVDERKRVVEADLVDELQGRLEVLVRFPGETDDEVRGDADPGPRGAELARDRLVFKDRIAPLHRREHAVGARLHRKVHVRG
jgi:hypothetical protein